MSSPGNYSLPLILDLMRTVFMFISLCFTGTTLIIAYKSYKKYINNKLLEKQLDRVLKLIEEINTNNFTFSFHLTDKTLTNYQIQLEQIQEGNNLVRYEKSEDQHHILVLPVNLLTFFRLDSNLLISKIIKFNINNILISYESMKKFEEISWFYYDPLLPKSIANKLKLFEVPVTVWFDRSSRYQDSEHIEIRFNHTGGIMSCISYSATESTGNAFRSWANFIQSSQELSKAISDWMKNNGITEINL